MVVALGPGKFYGSSLPRPRFYTDVKFNDERVDPPPSVTDPLMEWAHEAHWSMGGLSFKRHRLQGRIEGNVERLRAQKETVFKKSHQPKKSAKPSSAAASRGVGKDKISKSPSPPPAPVAIKRRRVVGLLDEEEEEVEEEVAPVKKGAVRKLGDDFERVARESGMAVKQAESDGGKIGGATAAKKKKLVKGGRNIGAAVVAAAAGIRSSPRLRKSDGLN